MDDAFDWKEEYNTGIQRIDHQHRYFYQLVHWMLEQLRASEPFELKLRYIDEVMHYGKFHFLSEMNCMKDHGYPGTEAHEELHGKLLKDLNVKVSQLEFGDIDDLEFVVFLQEWFIEHTVKEDKQIGIYIQGEDAKGNT
jgi:hemerythrin